MCARRMILPPAFAVAAVLGPLTGAASADDGGTAYINDEGDPTAEANTGTDGQPADGGDGDSPCTWTVWIEDDFVFHVFETEGVPIFSETGRWLLRTCERVTEDGLVAIDESILPEGGPVDPAALALQALDSVSVPDPTIGTSPDAGDLVVHVPTWLWVSGDWWGTYTAEANAGRVVSTVTVEPSRAVWMTGDGGQVTCTGPGTAWSPGMPEDATDCTHTYTTPSEHRAGGTYELSVDIDMNVTWSSNAGPDGELPLLSRDGTASVRVGEIQAIETG